MPIHRYQIRNVYSLADPELYKPADKDDPEALLEGVAMAGLVGVLRQLGDLAEFAADIFHDLHEEVMATAARGHDLRVRVQQLESEIPPIERAFLSQTSHSAFFPNSGIDWHPNRQTTQNLITKGDLPRFVMDSYEECRGPPRLFLLDKFDIGGAGACLKRYTDPSTFKVEASSYEIENAETQREKKICQTKKKGLKWKGGETPEVSQPSHAKLHQLFLEDRVQTGATEAAHHVKLKTRPKKFPFDSESRECYMNKLLNSPSSAHEVPPIPSNGSRLEDGVIIVSALGLPMKNTSPCVSSSKLAESQPSHADLEVDDNQITGDNVHTDGLQDGYPSEDVASETDNYMDALATMESEVETSLTQGTYSDANKHQLQSQLSDSQSIENLTASYEGNNSTTKGITGFGNSDTTSTSFESISPFRADSPPRPFACIEIPFRPRVSPVADHIPVTQNLGHTNTNDTCIDTSKVSNVNQVESVEEGTSNSNKVCSGHTEKLDSPRKSEEHQIYKKDTAKYTSEQSDVLPIADGLSSFSFVRNHKGDLDYTVDVDNHEDDGHSVSEQGFKESGEKDEVDEVLIISPDDLNDNDVDSPSYNSKILQDQKHSFLAETDQKHKLVIPDLGSQPVDIGPCVSNVQLIDSAHEASYSSPLKDKADQFNNQLHIPSSPEILGSQLGSLTQADHKTHIDTHLQDLQSSSESYSVLLSEKPPTMELSSHDIISDQDDSIAPCHHESNVSTEADHNIKSKSLNHGDHIDVFEAPTQSSPLEDKVDQPINQLNLQIQGLQSSPESYSVPVSEKPPTMELNNNLFDQVKSPMLSGFGILPQLAPVKPEEDPPPLPPLPPMQWRTRKLQSSLSTPTISHQEVFWPSSSPYPFPPVLDEMHTNIQPMKVQRPRSPLIDAVAAHDKTKLRKVSDQDATQMPKGEERDTLLDQIRAKSINLKPAVQTRPIIQGPGTNLRVAAILEKANAIRQAFAGSDDDDDSDNWSDL